MTNIEGPSSYAKYEGGVLPKEQETSEVNKYTRENWRASETGASSHDRFNCKNCGIG